MPLRLCVLYSECAYETSIVMRDNKLKIRIIQQMYFYTIYYLGVQVVASTL